jgi:hypothetical protein
MGLLLGGLTLALVACGAAGTTTSSKTAKPARAPASGAPDPSSSPFLARADTICARINAEIVALKANSASSAEVKRVVPPTISIERKGIAALEKLSPPASLAQDWQRMLGYRRTLARELGELLDAAIRNDGTSVAPLAASKRRVHASLSQTATADGFKDCAKVGRVG